MDGVQEAVDGSISDSVRLFLSSDDLDSLLNSNLGLYPRFMGRLSETLEQGFVQGCEQALFEAHKALYYLYEDHIRTPRPGVGMNQYHPFVIRVRNDIEGAWEASELSRVSVDPGEIPAEEEDFIRLLRERFFSQDLSGHPLFDFLEKDATYEEIVSFFLYEGMLVLRFCDLIVLSMLGVDDEVRQELSENFWDEVGNGNYKNRHTEQFRRLLRHVGLNLPDGHLFPEAMIDRLNWQGLAGYNLYFNLSFHRRNYFKFMGCLGVAEMLDPGQYERILRGCRRVGLKDRKALAYYANHAELDVAHGEGWLENVLLPLSRRHPEARHDMLVGALMRINTAADYYDFLYRRLAKEGTDLQAIVTEQMPGLARAGVRNTG